MKFRNYKQLLTELNKTKQVILTISLWTYNSKRMVFKVPFEQIQNCLDGDMIFNHSDKVLKFTALNGQEFKSRLNKLRIAKIDSVEVVERNPMSFGEIEELVKSIRNDVKQGAYDPEEILLLCDKVSEVLEENLTLWCQNGGLQKALKIAQI